jgi:hypothetical protein
MKVLAFYLGHFRRPPARLFGVEGGLEGHAWHMNAVWPASGGAALKILSHVLRQIGPIVAGKP